MSPAVTIIQFGGPTGNRNSGSSVFDSDGRCLLQICSFSETITTVTTMNINNITKANKKDDL